VSLGAYSTIGSLMGFIIGRSFFIEGYFARLMYRGLYKMHEAALHGRGRTLLRLVAPGGAARACREAALRIGAGP
jgi:NADH:ubiquinone reductase (H+-translocating)